MSRRSRTVAMSATVPGSSVWDGWLALVVRLEEEDTGEAELDPSAVELEIALEDERDKDTKLGLSGLVEESAEDDVRTLDERVPEDAAATD